MQRGRALCVVAGAEGGWGAGVSVKFLGAEGQRWAVSYRPGLMGKTWQEVIFRVDRSFFVFEHAFPGGSKEVPALCAEECSQVVLI